MVEGTGLTDGVAARVLRRRTAGEDLRCVEAVRVVAGSTEAAFAAWTKREEIECWICPDPTARVVVENDLRPTGEYAIRMETAAGTHTVRGVYREVVPFRRLAFTWDWQEAPQAMGAETVVTVEFVVARAESGEDGGSAARVGGRRSRRGLPDTRVRLRHCGFPSDEAAEGHRAGWGLSLDRMVEVLG